MLAEHTSQSWYATEGWEVVHAFYGHRDGSAGAEATMAVRQRLQKGGRVWANNALVGDPCVGERKYLRITLRQVPLHSIDNLRRTDATSCSPRHSADNRLCACGDPLPPHGCYCRKCKQSSPFGLHPSAKVIGKGTATEGYLGAASTSLAQCSSTSASASCGMHRYRRVNGIPASKKRPAPSHSEQPMDKTHKVAHVHPIVNLEDSLFPGTVECEIPSMTMQPQRHKRLALEENLDLPFEKYIAADAWKPQQSQAQQPRQTHAQRPHTTTCINSIILSDSTVLLGPKGVKLDMQGVTVDAAPGRKFTASAWNTQGAFSDGFSTVLVVCAGNDCMAKGRGRPRGDANESAIQNLKHTLQHWVQTGAQVTALFVGDGRTWIRGFNNKHQNNDQILAFDERMSELVNAAKQVAQAKVHWARTGSIPASLVSPHQYYCAGFDHWHFDLEHQEVLSTWFRSFMGNHPLNKSGSRVEALR